MKNFVIYFVCFAVFALVYVLAVGFGIRVDMVTTIIMAFCTYFIACLFCEVKIHKKFKLK